MLRGLYTAGYGMLSKAKSMDVISNNLANMNTVGYKKDVAIFESFPDVLSARIRDEGTIRSGRMIGDVNLGADVGEVFTNHLQGSLQKTDRTLDMAIEGSRGSFFSISVPGEEGEAATEMYTRNGAFTLNSEGVLVNLDGYPVLGENGPITLQGEQFDVRENGDIYMNDQLVDRLLIREFDETRDLIKRGDNLLMVNPEVEEPVQGEFTGRILQGFIEASNVHPVKEMVQMIEVMRAYESNQKVVQAVDEMIQKAVNEVGSI